MNNDNPLKFKNSRYLINFIFSNFYIFQKYDDKRNKMFDKKLY